MSMFYCPYCGANLSNQKGYDISTSTWKCKCCGMFLMDDDRNNEDLFDEHVWFCTKCNALLNRQAGFSNIYSAWRCSECGYYNATKKHNADDQTVIEEIKRQFSAHSSQKRQEDLKQKFEQQFEQQRQEKIRQQEYEQKQIEEFKRIKKAQKKEIRKKRLKRLFWVILIVGYLLFSANNYLKSSLSIPVGIALSNLVMIKII